MLTKITSSKAIVLLLLFYLGPLNSIFSQEFNYMEFKIDSSHLSPLSIQKTLDGSLLLVCHQYCFYPNGTVIEGCPITNQFIKIDENLDIKFRKDIFMGGDFYPQEWNELPNGDFFVFAGSNSNFSCGDAITTLHGFERFERYHIDSEANLLEYQVYNDECTIEPQSYIPTINNQYLAFVRTEDETFEQDHRILFIDSNYDITDSRIYNGLKFSNLQLYHVTNDSLYGIYTRTVDGSLNSIAFDLSSTNYNQRVLTSLGSAGNYYSIKDFKKDSNNNLYVASSNDDIKISKHDKKGELVWIKTLPDDIANPRIKLQNIEENKIAVLSGFLNSTSNTIDSRIQILDKDGTEIFRQEYGVDTTNIIPVDFEFMGNSVVIVGIANRENHFTPSTPLRTFILFEQDYLSSTKYNSKKSEIKTYPNPTSGIVKIDSDNLSLKSHLNIYHVSGKLMKSLKAFSDEIDISDLPSGVYIAVIKNNQNIAKTFKIVKK